MFWLLLCGMQWLLGSGAEVYPGETIRVPRYVRLLFGLAPSTDTLRMRPAIMQILAIIMMPVSIYLRRMMAMTDLALAMLLMLFYWSLPVMMIALGRKSRRQ
jgi:uncharacterized membrane protein YqaE (UPF0057 family)